MSVQNVEKNYRLNSSFAHIPKSYLRQVPRENGGGSQPEYDETNSIEAGSAEDIDTATASMSASASGASLPILATQPTVRQAVDKDPSWVLKYSSVPEVTGQAGGRVRVKVNVEGSGARFLDGDYYVFGLGQGGEPLSAIDAAIKSKMEPIFDKNLCLGGGGGG